MLLLRKHLLNFGTQNNAFGPQTVLHLFTARRLLKCSETLPNIILGLMEQNGRFCCESIFATLVPQNSAFRPETEVLIFLRAQGWRSAL
jgi:hypothetical protein